MNVLFDVGHRYYCRTGIDTVYVVDEVPYTVRISENSIGKPAIVVKDKTGPIYTTVPSVEEGKAAVKQAAYTGVLELDKFGMSYHYGTP